jgi:NSS family neurotransmitter:Na+ symporter
MFFTVLIVLGGIKNGIEKSCKILMPVFFALMIVLMIRSLTLDGASAGIEFLIYPDFSKIDSNVILLALGQTLFSLSIGCGILTYGSYMRKQDNIVKGTYWIASTDTLFALLAGLAVIPAVFALGFEPTEGPGLVFIVLPQIFSQIAGGVFLQIIFFFALIIGAITSAISLLETSVSYVSEEWKISRKSATIISASAITFVGCFCALSLSDDFNFTVSGKNLFDIIEGFASNILIPLSAIATALLIGWKVKKTDAIDEITNSGTLRNSIVSFFLFLLKFVVPLALVTILLAGLF